MRNHELPEDDDTADVEDLARVPRPGQLIRSTRQKRELSLEELGERTRLTEAVLKAVESDDYPGLGQPVYARGYYRKCAQALGLNGEMLVDAYEKHSGTGSPIPVIHQRPSIPFREGPGIWKIAAGMILIGALLGGAAWWLLQSGAGAQWLERLSSADAAPSETAPAATPRPRPRPAAKQPAAQPEPRQPVRAEASPAPTAEPAAPAPVESKATPPPAGPLALQLRTGQGQAWVDVRDHSGKQLLYKLLPPGEQREIAGQPPFQVSLGRADQVRLWLDGELVDFSGVIQADLRARFRILANGQVEG